MKGIEVPARTDDFTADPVELFFDLAYVFAFSQLVGLLIHDPTWGGVGTAALLFGLLWLPWQQLTWAANAVSGNGRRIRMMMLAATVISVPMAAATSSALGSGGVVFAISLAGIMIVGFSIQMMTAGGIDEDDAAFREAIIRWIAPNLLAIAVLVVGAFTEDGTRVVLWLVAVVLVLGAMIAAGSGEWLVRLGHMAERHGLIVIVALGEVIVAIGLPVVAALQEGDGLPWTTVAALVASGGFAGLLWWGYFDRPSPGLEHHGLNLTSDNERGRYVRDVYTWAHAPIVAGIILAAAALEEIALHPRDQVELPFRLMMLFGLGLVLFGISVSIWRAFRAVASERLIAIVVIAGVILLGSSMSGLALLTLVVAIMFVTLMVEHRRVEEVLKERLTA